MKRILMYLVVTAFGVTTTWSQNCDFNGDGVVNSADVVCVYNYIINGGTGDVTTADVAYIYNYIINGETGEEFTVNGITFKMITVKGGTFQMGATSEQGSDAFDDEKPVHLVTLDSYKIGETEVTQALWKAVMGDNPSYFKGDDLPVEQVSWDDCQEFIKKLNTMTDKQFRLPTEAEWEYAYRGGNKSKGYKYSGTNTISDVAWYSSNSNYKTHSVATKQPNELGIYDMSGNVCEWCQDWYGGYSSSSQINPAGPNSGTYRVYRGGSWSNNARYCRSSNRSIISPDGCNIILGLRLVLP